MNIRVERSEPNSMKADILILTHPEGVKSLGGVGASLDKALGGVLTREISETGFTGRHGSSLMLQTNGAIRANRVLLIGSGKVSDFTLEKARSLAASAAKKARDLKQKRIAMVLPASTDIKTREMAQAVTEGSLLALYRYDKYREKKDEKEKGATEFVIVERDGSKARAAEQGIEDGKLAVRGTVLARDLVNEPASIATPAHLVEHAERIAKENPGITVKIFDRKEAARLGMGAFLAVAQGATEDPYFIHLTYKPRGAKKRIAVVGKGITFDSGGLQIKPGDYMTTMKCDMAGAAAVLGLFSVIRELAPKVEVHGVIAATENMPGRSAYKPGDVVRAMNGTTIEIGHTDAEGRVTLADSLSYAVQKKPDIIIDLATLTGACVAALGEEIAGIMSNDKKLTDRLMASANETGERLWELPLAPEYAGLVKSDIAELKNVSSTRYGGAITAGLFLQNFVDDIPWAHLDIAGPAFAERESIAYMPKGGTGYGVRMLINFLKKF